MHAIVGETGSASFLGTEEAAAFNALAKHVNATGGIDGHPLAFAISDNQSTASTSVSLASPLVGQAPVLLVGSITSTDKPVDDLVTSSGPVVYDLSPGDHPALGSYVYSSSNSTINQTQAFINFAESKGWKKVAVINSTDSSGQDGWTNIQRAVAGSNGAVTVTDHEAFDPTAVSVTTQLSKIKATNPQAVLVWTTGTPLGTVLSGMQQLGMNSLPTMTTNGNASYSEMQKLAGELPAQLYFPGAPFMVGTAGPDRADQDRGAGLRQRDAGGRAEGPRRRRRARLGPRPDPGQRAEEARHERHGVADPPVHRVADQLRRHQRHLQLHR